MRQARLTLVLLAVVVGACSSGGETNGSAGVDTTAASGAEPGGPAQWDAFLGERQSETLASEWAWDGSELIVVGNRMLGETKWVVDNGPLAYSPADGTWRDLPELPFAGPIVGPRVVATPAGIVVAGVRCDDDNPEFQADFEDLDCEPGTAALAVRPPGSDVLEAIDLPGELATAVQALQVTPSSDGAYIGADGHFYELAASGNLEALSVPPSSSTVCQVGDRLLVHSARSRLSMRRGEEWVDVVLPSPGNDFTVTCAGGAALVSLGQPATDGTTHVLFRQDGDQVRLTAPAPGCCATWDGNGFILQGSFDPSGELGSTAKPLYALGVDGQEWVLVDGELDHGVEVRALNGTVAVIRRDLLSGDVWAVEPVPTP